MLTAFQINLLAVAGVLSVRQLCRRLRYPAPPIRLLLLAACLLPWLAVIRGATDLSWAAGLQTYIRALSELLAGFTIIRVLGWLILEVPPHLGWWKAIPKIVRDLLMLGVAVTLTLVVIHHQLKINLIGIAATSAVLTAVVGLAGQSTLKDIFAGIALQIDAPFVEGDWIDLGVTQGVVLSLRLMSTRLSSMDGAQLVIPNSRITAEGLRRFRPQEPIGSSFEIALDFSLPARQAILILEDVLLKHPRVLSQPRPRAWVTRYSETGVIYQAQYWRSEIGDLADYQLRSELLEQIWYSLRRAGQTIPYPGLDLRRKRNNDPQVDQSITTDQRAKILKQHTLFSHLAPEQLNQLAKLTRCIPYAPNEAVVQQGEPGSSLYVVVQGELVVTKQNETGQATTISHLQAGDIFGEMAVCTGSPRSASVVCLGESMLLEVERDNLLALIKQDPLILEALSELIARREQELNERTHDDPSQNHKALSQTIKHLFEGLLKNFH